MKVRGLHHVNVNVRDVDESVAFYRSIGFESVPRPDFGFPGAWLQMGDDQLHLVESPDAQIDRGQHFALGVDDVEACANELAALGIKVSRPQEVDGAGRQAFFRDPSGNLIELNQPA